MNKTELIKAVSEEADVSIENAKKVLDATLDTIIKEVAEGGDVTLTGFGKFERRYRAERNGVNPQTQEPMLIPERYVPAFKVGKTFKDVVDA